MATVPGQAPWPHNWEPYPGNFANMLQTLMVALNTEGPALVGTATTTIFIGVPITKQFIAIGASIQGQTPFTGSSTVTATIIKVSAGTRTALSAALDLTGAYTNNSVALPLTGTNAQCTCAIGDVLACEVACGGTVGPTTADAKLSVEINLNH